MSTNLITNKNIISARKTINEKESIINQQKVIENNRDQYPDNYLPPYHDMISAIPGIFGDRLASRPNNTKSDKYDALGDFLHKKGLSDRDQIKRYYTHYLNIDSSLRNTKTSEKTEMAVTLDHNPFTFTKDSNKLFINQQNHMFNVNDKISISGVSAIKRNLQLKNQSNDPHTTSTNIIQFTTGSIYATVAIPHRMTFKNLTEAKEYDVSNIYIEIAGVNGYPGNAFIANIPVNTINTRHQILLINPDTPTKYSDNVFYFKLLKEFTGDNKSWQINIAYTMSITFHYIAGIPINKINAEAPVSFDILQEYQVIKEIDKNGYTILLSKTASGQLNSNDSTGGSNIVVSRISETVNGYPDPNHYLVQLDNTFNNVVQIRLISSEFPNCQRNVRLKNKLYWQNLDDGDTVYTITLDQGNYLPKELSNEITKQVLLVPRIDSANLGDPILTDSPYSNKNIINVDINTVTNKVKFTSFREALLNKPFLKVEPIVDSNILLNPTDVPYEITVRHPNHSLKTGDQITITDSLTYNGIPANKINTTHNIFRVIDENSYIIRIEHFNFEPVVNNGGGSSIVIYVKNNIKLFFNYPDTLGHILGFRNTGEPTSITPFNTEINNNDPYEFESTMNNNGTLKTFVSDPLRFDDINYILVTCNQLKGIYTSGKVKDSIAKILFKNKNETQIDTFVSSPLYFFSTLHDLSELEFTFYNPDGELYDFFGLDHSFTLEIVTLNEIPKGTNIDQLIGLIN